jgi:flagellar hook-basal body complex protein FliE
MPIDPSFSIGGPEWQIGGVGNVGGADGATQPSSSSSSSSSSGFGDMLGKAIDSVGADQENASAASRALATGQASDPTAVVMAVERAQLSMQLASQIRSKVVEAAQDIFHTQV